ncbi:MAG: thioredoxin [Verrucomicrobia bacterium]|nr:thioredoxin [Verrucomicrobiota bacterium]
MASANVVTLSSANFDTEVVKSAVPVLVDFWAEWCGPCKMIAPVLDQIADEQTGKVKIAKLNVDDSPDLAGKFGIRAIPTLLIFQGGVVKEQMVGLLSKKDIQKKLAAYLG